MDKNAYAIYVNAGVMFETTSKGLGLGAKANIKQWNKRALTT